MTPPKRFEMRDGGWLWLIRGSLCRWLRHSAVATDPTWSDILGPRICQYCYCPLGSDEC